jgi:23S rRNA (adenine-N6)-dimethyltransferase
LSVPGGRRRGRRADLSQHFLRSQGLARTLVRQAELSPTDLVVEIGAGSGVLTSALVDAAREVRAIEVDPWLATKLRRRFEATDGLAIVEADFFDTPLPREPYTVFANVPFNRTADVVRRLTAVSNPPEDAFLVVQAEAAARFAGRPYGLESVASLALKPWWHLEVRHWFRRTDFSPPPAVDSVLLQFARRRRPLLEDGDRTRYTRFLEASFGAGDVARGLRRSFPPREVRLAAGRLRFDPGGPPSALLFEQWLALFRQQRGHEPGPAPAPAGRRGRRAR